MLKEIMEQPEALRRAISPRVKEGKVVFDDLKLPVEKMREFTRIFIVACGSSYHVGMLGKYTLEHLLRRNTFIGNCYNEFQEQKDAPTLLPGRGCRCAPRGSRWCRAYSCSSVSGHTPETPEWTGRD